MASLDWKERSAVEAIVCACFERYATARQATFELENAHQASLSAEVIRLHLTSLKAIADDVRILQLSATYFLMRQLPDEEIASHFAALNKLGIEFYNEVVTPLQNIADSTVAPPADKIKSAKAVLNNIAATGEKLAGKIRGGRIRRLFTGPWAFVNSGIVIAVVTLLFGFAQKQVDEVAESRKERSRIVVAFKTKLVNARNNLTQWRISGVSKTPTDVWSTNVLRNLDGWESTVIELQVVHHLNDQADAAILAIQGLQTHVWTRTITNIDWLLVEKCFRELDGYRRTLPGEH